MTDTTTAPEALPTATFDYVRTHCTTCKAGWTRRNEAGQAIVVCLLNREPVWQEMTACDRFEDRKSPGKPRRSMRPPAPSAPIAPTE